MPKLSMVSIFIHIKNMDILLERNGVYNMIKKYSYQIEFLSRELSPTKTKYFSASGECLLKEMKNNFNNFLKENSLSAKGSTKGAILDVRGNVIGNFIFSSTTIN